MTHILSVVTLVCGRCAHTGIDYDSIFPCGLQEGSFAGCGLRSLFDLGPAGKSPGVFTKILEADMLIWYSIKNSMEGWVMKWWPVLLISAVCAVVYLLYRQGIGVSKNITAILYVFRPQKDSDKVTLDSCTGWTSHVGRFHESRTYEFTLDRQLSKGDVEVLLLDKKKQQLLKLDRQLPTGRAELDGKSRYYLRWEFKNATGSCELHW